MKAYFIYFAVLAFLTYLIFFHKSKKKSPDLQKRPKNGDFIRMTWFPNPKNNPSETNCYIGSEGVVEDLQEDGSFTLNMGGAILLVHKNYKWEPIEYWYKDELGNENILTEQYKWDNRLISKEVQEFYGNRIFTKIKSTT